MKWTISIMSSRTERAPTLTPSAGAATDGTSGAASSGPFSGTGEARPFPLPLESAGETGEAGAERALTASKYDMRTGSESGAGVRAGAGTGMSADETAMGGVWRSRTVVRGTR